MRDNKGKSMVSKAKRTLDYAIKDYRQELRLKELKKQAKNPQSTNLADRAFEKMMEMKTKKLAEDVENQ